MANKKYYLKYTSWSIHNSTLRQDSFLITNVHPLVHLAEESKIRPQMVFMPDFWQEIDEESAIRYKEYTDEIAEQVELMEELQKQSSVIRKNLPMKGKNKLPPLQEEGEATKEYVNQD